MQHPFFATPVRSIFLLGLLFLTAPVFSACAPAAKVIPDASWPSPPMEPIIRYVATLRGEEDYQRISFFDRIFGAKSEGYVDRPYGIAKADGELYVSQIGGRIRGVKVMDPEHKSVRNVGSKGANRLGIPLGIEVHKGQLFVCDAKAKSVRVFNRAGEELKAIGSANDFVNPVDIAVNEQLSRLYIVDSKSHSVKVFSPGGEKLFEIGARGAGDGEFNFPTGIDIDRRTGDIMIVDSQNHRVQVLDKDGKFLRKFGKAGDGPGEFGNPTAIAHDSDGNIYVTDGFFSGVQVFLKKENTQMWIGEKGNPASPASFNNPGLILVDEQDKLYVTDQLNNRVQVFQVFTEKWKKEHAAEYAAYVQSRSATMQTGSEKKEAQPKKDEKAAGGDAKK